MRDRRRYQRLTDEEIETIKDDIVDGIRPTIDVLIRLLAELTDLRSELAQIDQVLGMNETLVRERDEARREAAYWANRRHS